MRSILIVVSATDVKGKICLNVVKRSELFCRWWAIQISNTKRPDGSFFGTLLCCQRKYVKKRKSYNLTNKSKDYHRIFLLFQTLKQFPSLCLRRVSRRGNFSRKSSTKLVPDVTLLELLISTRAAELVKCFAFSSNSPRSTSSQ